MTHLIRNSITSYSYKVCSHVVLTTGLQKNTLYIKRLIPGCASTALHKWGGAHQTFLNTQFTGESPLRVVGRDEVDTTGYQPNIDLKKRLLKTTAKGLGPT